VPALPPAVERARLSAETIQSRLSDPASMAEARTELRSIVAYIQVNPVGSRDQIQLTVWSHFGRLFTPATPTRDMIERMEAALRTVV